MIKPLQNKKVAILAASGINEEDMTSVQRELAKAGATVRIISIDNAMITCWRENEWGHALTVDVPLKTALGVDYDMLVLPGGERSHEKLKKTAHTRRFISSFLTLNRPIGAIGNGEDLLKFAEADLNASNILVADLCELNVLINHFSESETVAQAA